MDRAKKSIQFIQEQGYRMTVSRRGIIEYLHSCKQPVSAYTIHAALEKKNCATNKSTVYRELEFLIKENIVTEVFLRNAQKYYEIAQEHHHHVVCIQCHYVEDVVLQNELHDEERVIERKSGFSGISHNLEFFGTCLRCRTG